MKKRNFYQITFISLISLLPSCAQFNEAMGWPNDNPVEQAAEFVIKEETGATVDLTPKEAPKKSNDKVPLGMKP
jgi:hypothetical protein